MLILTYVMLLIFVLKAFALVASSIQHWLVTMHLYQSSTLAFVAISRASFDHLLSKRMLQQASLQGQFSEGLGILIPKIS